MKISSLLGSHYAGLYELKPVEEKIFEAKITDVFHYGYTIESNIDGKALRGLLFSYKPGFAHAVHAYLTRLTLLTVIIIIMVLLLLYSCLFAKSYIQ